MERIEIDGVVSALKKGNKVYMLQNVEPSFDVDGTAWDHQVENEYWICDESPIGGVQVRLTEKGGDHLLRYSLLYTIKTCTVGQ